MGYLGGRVPARRRVVALAVIAVTRCHNVQRLGAGDKQVFTRNRHRVFT